MEEILEMAYGNPPNFRDRKKSRSFEYIASLVDSNPNYVGRFLRKHATWNNLDFRWM